MIDKSGIQNRPVERSPAFKENTVNFHFSKFLHQIVQIKMTVSLFCHQNLASALLIQGFALRILTTGGKNDWGTLSVRRLHNLGSERCSKMRVADNANRISPTRDSTSQQRIIRKHRSDSRHNRRIAVSLPLYMCSRLLSRNPLRCACRSRNLSIECHRIFHHDIRKSCADIPEKYPIEFSALLFKHMLGDLHAVIS